MIKMAQWGIKQNSKAFAERTEKMGIDEGLSIRISRVSGSG